MSKSFNVKVFCRIRPENEKELQSGFSQCLSVTSPTSLKIKTDQQPLHTQSDSTPQYQEFTFDSVFPQTTPQSQIFNETAKPLITSALNGINCTLFCYGQTSSGKTFTMEGIKDDLHLKGIIPRTMDYIFELIPQSSNELEFSIKCQYYQIYNEKIQDLLDPHKTDLTIREDKSKGIWIEDCTEVYVSSKEEMKEVFQCGNNNRVVSATEMNKGSSRSHSLFCVTVFQRNVITGSTQSGKMCFVDLAGSEKMSKTRIDGGSGLKEAQNINKSLMTLGMVINALTDNASHVPYRDSKLTRVLQESLGGNSLTTLIVTCSANGYNQSESLSTLRFGQRAKLIKNKVTANTQRSAKELLLQLSKANEKIKQLETIINNTQHTTIKGDDDGNYKHTGQNVNECEGCAKARFQYEFKNIELINLQQEFDELQRDKHELETELTTKNNMIFTLNDNISKLNKSIQSLTNDKQCIINDIQNYSNTIDTLHNKLHRYTTKQSLTSTDISFITEHISSLLSTWKELLTSFDNETSTSNSLTENKVNQSRLSSNSCNNIFNRTNFILNGTLTIQVDNTSSRRHRRCRVLSIPKSRKNEQLSSLKQEIVSYKQQLNEYQDITNTLTKKLFLKENEFYAYKERTMTEFKVKEMKMVELVNKLNELEDENYKLLHCGKKSSVGDKKKIIIMDKQMKVFMCDMEKMRKCIEEYKQQCERKDKEIEKMKKEITDLKEECKCMMQLKNNGDVSFANENDVNVNNNNNNNVISFAELVKQNTCGVDNSNNNRCKYKHERNATVDLQLRKSEESNVSFTNISCNSVESNVSGNFSVIKHGKIIKMIRGGKGKKESEHFFSTFLNTNLAQQQQSSQPQCIQTARHTNVYKEQFQKEMNILNDDNISEFSSL